MENEDKRVWDDETIGRVYGIMDEILYSIALYRAIRPWDRDDSCYDPFLREFWIRISNNAIQMAIINWCKIFGKEHNNRTHYSHFVTPERFTDKLDKQVYEELWDGMLNVRDKFAAHEDDIKDRKKIPDLNQAMEVMEAFRETTQEEYDIPELPPIKTMYEAYQIRIQDQLQKCRIDWEIPEMDE